MSGFPLSILVWLPLAVALVALLLPRALAPKLVFVGSLATLVLSVLLLIDYNPHGGLQYVTDKIWIRELGVHYKLGIDGLNAVLLVVTTVIFSAGQAWALKRKWDRPHLFAFHIALAESAVLGAFVAQDLLLFVVFFDVMLVPFYFLAGQWGEGERRVQATTKLVIYTLVGSLLMLVGAIAMGVLAAQDGQAVSFAFTDLAARPLGVGTQEWIFLCFAAAFLVKMPAFPFHGWMPDGYRAIPLPVLAIFSAVLSKVAAYGFLKIVLPLLPDASVHFQTLLLLIGLASILYGSAMAFTATNTRLILGYSSLAQLGFIVFGIFALDPKGAQGALFQMVNHAIVVAPLFFIVALLAARAGGSEDLRDMGGIAFRAPVLATLFLIAALANLAIPGSANFVAEFLILLGVFETKLVLSIVAFTGVVLASVYMLRAFIRSMHNRVAPKVTSRDITGADAIVLVPLTLVILALAVYPQMALNRSEPTVNQVVTPAKAIARGEAVASVRGADAAAQPAGSGVASAAAPTAAVASTGGTR